MRTLLPVADIAECFVNDRGADRLPDSLLELADEVESYLRRHELDHRFGDTAEITVKASVIIDSRRTKS